MIEQRLKKFIDGDLKQFSNLDNVRSIPSLIDGFKDSQRKAVFGLIKHGNEKIKVAQLAGYSALVSEYAHGEGSMASTIVGLAQNYPGSNNVNLFEPIGQFGSILSGEAASPRYIYTKPSKNLRKYIRLEDDQILTHKIEEDVVLEPEYYLPILPMWILNGSIGVGTGHSCKILSRDPVKVAKLVSDIVNAIKKDKPLPESGDLLIPYFEGWKGKVTQGDSETQWIMTGVLEKVNSTTLKITELPVQYGVDKYKQILIDLMDQGIVKDYDNNSNEESFEFIVSVPREVGRNTEEKLISMFKLSARFGENVTLWGVNGKLKRYDNVYAALVEFVKFRLSKYIDRKNAQLSRIDADLEWAIAKQTFINWWNTREEPHKLDRAEVELLLTTIRAEMFDALFNMPIRSLTLDKVKELEKDIEVLKQKKEQTELQTTHGMFLDDLKGL